MIEPDYKEIHRLLGYKKILVDGSIASIIDECVKEINGIVTPRYTYSYFTLKHIPPDTCIVGDLCIKSKSLYANSNGCEKMCMLAATIGIEFDRLIRRTELNNILKAAVLQACGAAIIEAYVNEINKKIVEEAKEKGFLCRVRFSPGYGDLPLSLQSNFEEILKMQRKCGISLTDTLLMIPTKSVTAFIAMYKKEDNK